MAEPTCEKGFEWRYGVCKQCDRGRYSPGGALCEDCQKGRYMDTVGVSNKLGECRGCAVGKFSGTVGNTRENQCARCPHGKFTPTQGWVSCTQCNPGYYVSQRGAESCSRCTEGSITDKLNATGAISCKRCPRGKFSPTPIVECASCAPGYFSDASGLSVCSPCPLGMFLPHPKTLACIPCAVGKYMDVTPASSCRKCEPGKFVASLGAKRCLDCGPGQFTNTSGLAACLNCPRGRYRTNSAGDSLMACLPCKRGTYANATGLSSCERCHPGQYAAQNAMLVCARCIRGKYSPGDGNSRCSACIAGRFTYAVGSNKAADCVWCAQGFYAPVNASRSCLACDPTTRTEDRAHMLAKATSGAIICDRCSSGFENFDPVTLKCTIIPPFPMGLFWGVFFAVVASCALLRKGYREWDYRYGPEARAHKKLEKTAAHVVYAINDKITKGALLDHNEPIDAHTKELAAMGALSPEEIMQRRKVRQLFEQMDSDRSGELDKKEFVKAMKAMGVKVMKSELNAIFALFDEDGDGGLSIDEFMASLIKYKQRSRINEFCIFFRRIREHLFRPPPSLKKINPTDFTGGFMDIEDSPKKATVHT